MVREPPKEAVNVDNAAQLFSQLWSEPPSAEDEDAAETGCLNSVHIQM